jgi:hypothetical protein
MMVDRLVPGECERQQRAEAPARESVGYSVRDGADSPAAAPDGANVQGVSAVLLLGQQVAWAAGPVALPQLVTLAATRRVVI